MHLPSALRLAKNGFHEDFNRQRIRKSDVPFENLSAVLIGVAGKLTNRIGSDIFSGFVADDQVIAGGVDTSEKPRFRWGIVDNLQTTKQIRFIDDDSPPFQY